MSDTSETVAEETESARTRKAFSVVSDHLRKATVGLESRGVSARLLPGLWHACMGVVVSTMDAKYASLLIEDRAIGIKGHGYNADAPPKEMSEAALTKYLEEVASAAEVLSGLLSESLVVLEEDDLDDCFPECVFDAMIQVLVPAWGPQHVRRALAEQWRELRAGNALVVTVMEPSRLNVARRTGAEIAPEQRAESMPSPAAPPAPSLPPRTASERFVEIFADADADPESGRGAWGVVMEARERGGRRETREICGPSPDATGRTSCIKAVLEALRAVDEGGPGASVRLETPSDFVVRAMSDPAHRPSGIRLESEESSWAELDALCARHAVDWRHVPSGMDREIGERCDRLVRRVLSSGEEA